MFLLTRRIFFPAIAVLALALFTGCWSYDHTPKRPMPEPPYTGETNKPSPPATALPPDSGDNMAPHILAWGPLSQEYHARPGELKAPFTFNLTNVFSGPVVIYDTSTTCDCTVASLPSKPWTLPTGVSGKIEATIDLSKKAPGVVTNEIIVFTSQGNRKLTVKAFVPLK